MDTIILNKLQAQNVTLLASGNPYGDKTKLAGETFSRFAYNGKAFIVNEKSPFINDFKNGDIREITLVQSKRAVIDDEGKETGEFIDTLQFGSHITNTQWKAFRKAEREESLEDAMFEGKLNTIKNLDFSKVDKSVIEALEAAF